MNRNSCFTGFPFLAVIINLPQAHQAVNSMSATAAGLSLLPLLLLTPPASALAGCLGTKVRIAPFYLIVAGAALQVVGVGLASSLPTSQTSLPRAQYGYEILMGLGFGFGLTALLIMVPLVVNDEDKRTRTINMTAIVSWYKDSCRFGGHHTDSSPRRYHRFGCLHGHSQWACPTWFGSAAPTRRNQWNITICIDDLDIG